SIRARQVKMQINWGDARRLSARGSGEFMNRAASYSAVVAIKPKFGSSSQKQNNSSSSSDLAASDRVVGILVAVMFVVGVRLLVKKLTRARRTTGRRSAFR